MKFLFFVRLIWTFLFVAYTPIQSQDNQLVLDNAGKTLLILPSYTNSKPITFLILNTEQDSVNKYKMNYRFLNNICDPFLLTEYDSIAEMKADEGLKFIIPKSNTNYLVYNLLVQQNEVLANIELQRIKSEHQIVEQKIKELEVLKSNLEQVQIKAGFIKAKKEKIKTKNELLAKNDKLNEYSKLKERISNRIGDIEKEINIFKSINQAASIKEISQLLKESNRLKTELVALEHNINNTKNTITKRIDKEINEIDIKIIKLEAEINENEFSKELQSKIQKKSEYEDILTNNSKPKYSVKKIGGIIIGSDRKSVHYDIVIGKDNIKAFSLKRMGDFPKFTEDDLIYVIIINAIKRNQSNPFNLTFSVEKGETVNSTSLRPSVEYKIQEGTDRKTFSDLDSAYIDFILPFGRKFKGNEIIKVSINTYIETITSDKTITTNNDGEIKNSISTVKEKSIVSLVEQEKYPQIRALYRYNLTPGLVLSTLTDSQFVKVKIGKNPDNETESIYKIDEIKGENKVFPIIAFSFYLKKVDIQEPLTFKEMLFPNPTIGFDLKNPDPTKNIFFGFSHEFLYRNMQLFWGFQYGEVTKLVNRNDCDEERDSSAPNTNKKHELKFCIGLKFNINFLTNIIN